MTPTHQERNSLGQATSPYLRQHRENPVHWQEWNEDTLQHARSTGKPILLSIGYAACHWCHVMARESFEDPETADLMNRYFVNIKVDREERPDVDQIYMAALHALGEQGGWPLTMFLTPDALPFWGGTYFPPEPSHGRPAFKQVLHALAEAFAGKPEAVGKNTEALKNHLERLKPDNVSRETPDPDLLSEFQSRALNIHDEALGGIKGAPKFPNAPILETWARASGGNRDTHYGKAFLNTIERLSNGGIYDHLGGGIARYSVDQYWLVPHFEKMLYDNAHYLRHLNLAYKMTGGKLFRQRMFETVEWLQRDMLLPDNTFASSLDADSEGVEGKFYVWRLQELEQCLGKQSVDFAKEYGLTTAGNWEGNNILNRLHFPIGSFESESKFETHRKTLLDYRNSRPRPNRDDKCLTDWNGYLIRALSEAGITLGQSSWIDNAEKAFHSLTESNSDVSEVPHSKLDGQSGAIAMATDFGSLINASLTLFETTGNAKYLDKSKHFLDVLEDNYADHAGGYFLTSSGIKDLIVRPSCDQDEANPSGASQILEGMIRYANLSGSTSILKRAEGLIANQQAVSRKSPYGMAGFMNALHSWFNHTHVAIFAEGVAAERFQAAALQVANLVTSVTINGTDTHLGIPIPESEKDAFAVICRGQSCSLPYHSPEELSKALAEFR